MAQQEQQGECGVCGVTGPLVEIQEHFFNEHVDQTAPVNDDNLEVELENASTSSSISTASTSTNSNRVWTRDSILALINEVKHQAQFLSTTIKNDKVWVKIAMAMQGLGFNVTSIQCRDKWKYLKQRYMKKKDNMKDTHTGEERIKFEFFDEIDELLRKKPNVQPLAIASSSRDNNTPLTTFDVDAELDLVPHRKKQKTEKTENKIHSLLNTMIATREQHEINRQRRHEEAQQLKRAAIDSFNEKMDALLQKF